MRSSRRPWRALVLSLLLVLGASACASVPKHRYGINEIRVDGLEDLDEGALLACIATRPREKLSIQLSPRSEPECGEPPFDEGRLSWRWFAWPWTDWPVFDAAIFRLDLKRVERWFEARGYYGARILEVEYEPAEVELSDQNDECDESCAVAITLRVEEGEPVRIRDVSFSGVDELPPELRDRLPEVFGLKGEQPFDEAKYDLALQDLKKFFRKQGRARAHVQGDVVVYRALGAVDISVEVDPGPVCHIGEVHLKSPGSVPSAPILAASKLESGEPYSEDEIEDAQRTIYEMGAFSSVRVEGQVDEGEGPAIDVLIEVEPRKESEVHLGAGLMSGQLSTGPYAADWVSVPQWDVHLLGSYENRNFFGGLRRFRVEERPRLLFLGAFPRVPGNSPRFGNLLSAEFHQPGVITPRTELFLEARWDHGPDPFQLFFRDDVGVAIGLARGFFKQRLKGRVAIHQELMFVSRRQPQFVLESEIYQDQPPSSYRLPFLEQQLALDLRDDPSHPSFGAYFRIGAHEAARVWDPSWNYVRLTPEARGYVPLGFGIVLAARFAVASMHIFSGSPKLNDQMRRLGPPTYRLRGGGATSNRGFLAGQLGDSEVGGLRKWESSLELRVPLASSFSLAFFGDMGDVYAGRSFRFSHLNTAVGGGVRYDTIVGPIRLDVGYRVRPLQRVDGSEPSEDEFSLGGLAFPGAIHLTLGEAF